MSDKFLFYSWIIGADILILYALNSLTYKPNSKQRRFIPYTLLMILLFALSATGYASSDYINYVNVLELLRKFGQLPTIEPVYWYIGEFVEYKNNLFRLLTYFLIYSILYYLIKNYSKDKNIAVSIYIILLFISVSSIIRASLCDVIFYLGVFAYFKKRNPQRLLLMVTLVLVSFCFHITAFISVIPLILCFLKLNKKTYKVCVYLFPVFVVISYLITKFIFSNIFVDSTYMGTDQTDTSRSALISQSLGYLCWAGILIIGIKNTEKYRKESSFNGYVCRIFFWFAYISLVLMFNPGSHYLYIRTLMHGGLPMLLVTTLVFIEGNKITRKRLLMLFLIGAIQIQITFYLMNQYYREAILQNLYIN